MTGEMAAAADRVTTNASYLVDSAAHDMAGTAGFDMVALLLMTWLGWC